MERFLEVSKNGRVFGLDLLRSIAILLVLLAHGDFLLERNFPNYHGIWIIDGVDVFFVLSGFLIGGILLKEFSKGLGQIHVFTFWKRRWYRTLPNYFLVLVLLIAINILWLKNNACGPQLWKYFLFAQNLLYPVGSFFPESWSLSVEEWFYIFLPLLCIILTVITKNFVRSFLLTALLLITFSLSYKIYKSFQFIPDFGVYDQYFKKVVVARLDSLAMGVLGAYWLFSFPQNFFSSKYFKFWAGIVLIIISIVYPFNQLKLILNSFMFSAGVLLCFPLCASLKEYPRYLGDGILYISVISYSLYLFHFSIVMWFLVGVDVYSSTFGTIWHYLLYFLLSFILSTINYKYFELFFLKRR